MSARHHVTATGAIVDPEAARGLVKDGLIAVVEAADFLRVSRTTVYALMDSGELPSVKLGRSRRIPRRAVVDLAVRRLRGSIEVGHEGGDG